MRQIYIGALQGGIKPQTTKYWNLRDLAQKKLKRESFDYVDGSAGTQSTELNNRKALDNWQIGEWNFFFASAAQCMHVFNEREIPNFHQFLACWQM